MVFMQLLTPLISNQHTFHPNLHVYQKKFKVVSYILENVSQNTNLNYYQRQKTSRELLQISQILSVLEGKKYWNMFLSALKNIFRSL